MTTNEKHISEREAFEKIATSIGWGYGFRMGDDGKYFSTATQTAYRIWQAALATGPDAAAPPTP